MKVTRKRSAHICDRQAREGARHFPEGIISEILSWLPMEDILRCRSVCKTWYGLTKHTHFVNLQSKRSSCQPSRVIAIPNPQDNLFLLDLEQNKAREIPLDNVESWGLSITGSCHGFLCMASESRPNPVVVCNPVTREQIILPESVPNFHFFDHHVGLGYDPSTKKYKAVRMYLDKSKFSKLQIITLGETSWRQLYAPCKILFWGLVGPVYCDGSLYWVIDRGSRSTGNEYILVLNLTTENFQTVRFPTDIRMPEYNPNWHDGNLQLLNLAGCVTLLEDEGRLMHIWRVTRNRDQVFAVHHYSCDMYVRWNVFSRPVLISMLGEDSFMLEVSKFGLHLERDLVQFFPQMRRYHNLRIDGLPRWFRCICFHPNLVSPLDAFCGAA